MTSVFIADDSASPDVSCTSHGPGAGVERGVGGRLQRRPEHRDDPRRGPTAADHPRRGPRLLGAHLDHVAVGGHTGCGAGHDRACAPFPQQVNYLQ